MNETIGLADAKAHLSEVIARVEAGDTIVVSRNGAPVAEIRPIRRLSPSEAVARIREIGNRAAKRNAGKAPWPEGRTLRQEMHADDRI
jgi:prevent-host-death family protein